MSGQPGFRIEDIGRRAPAALLEQFVGLPTPTLADVMHRLGAMDAGIKPVWLGACCVGSVLPVWVREGDNLMIHKALNMSHPGDVLVINGGRFVDRALFGELMGTSAKALGVRGLVIDGAVRDAEGLRKLALPVFARGVVPAGPFKDGPGEIGRPVACGGVVCNAGDVVVADGDGVVIVPLDDAEYVIEATHKKMAQEKKRVAEIRGGRPQRGGIDEVLVRAGVIRP